MNGIVGVHGVGNYRPGETPEAASRQLSATWHHNLSMNVPDPSRLDVAYYADLLRQPGRQGQGDSLDALSPEAETMLRVWLTSVGVPEAVSQGWGTWPMRQALAWVAERKRVAPRLLELFVSTFFREVSTYLGPADSARTAARDRVVNLIRDRKPRTVIAHSLGSVVAYEALWACPDEPVDLLITLGSPLAMPHVVFPRLDPRPADERGARPPGVARWVNLADPGDLIALPPGGLSRRFTGVDTDDHDVVHAFDFHLAANYLRCERLAKELLPNA
ncbi:serine peptidase [Saccharothrix sp. NPDC042600]|uniref:serine peptidase n=1 Tax=Saccharothrix TaxID=2071 RepID=UPI0033D560DD|nr:hypothetical protein GCM10017745_50080 [Saccharothrix mutabilis subsp. capreolus]